MEPEDGVGEHDEAALISRVRAGDEGAYAELFARHHGAALRYARSIAGPSEADDLVSEAFAKVLSALQRDLGPHVSFRAYLYTSIRRLWANALRSRSRSDVVEDVSELADRQQARTVLHETDHWSGEAIGEAFRRLPERWREVLWLTNVEGYSHADIAQHLSIQPNAVAALNFRAREGLRREYLAQHLTAASDLACQATLSALPAYVRETLDSAKSLRAAEHLETCSSCRSGEADLRAINENLAVALPAIAAAGLFSWEHVSANTSVPPAPEPAVVGSARIRRSALAALAAAVLVAAGVLLWPDSSTPPPRIAVAPTTPAPVVQIVDLGLIPTPKPRPTPVRPSPIVQPAPKPAPPVPTGSIPTADQGTSVTGVTGGHSTATVSASAP